MNIVELSQIVGYSEAEARAILFAGGYQIKGDTVTGLVAVDGKNLTADEYLEAAKKTGVNVDQLPPAPQSSTAALAPTDKGAVAKKGGRKKKGEQLQTAGESYQATDLTLQEQTAIAGVNAGVELAELFAGARQMGMLKTMASRNQQLADVMGGQIQATRENNENTIDIEAIYESAAMGKLPADTVGLQLFGN